jgi:hypothetical protein
MNMIQFLIILIIFFTVIRCSCTRIRSNTEAMNSKPITIVCGNSIPNTKKVKPEISNVAETIVKFNEHWLMSPKDIPKDAKYTVVVHEGSVIHALHLMAKHKKFDNVREIVVCCTHFIPLDGITHNHEQRNKDAMRHLEKYKKDLKGVKIIVLTMTDLSPVMDAIFKRGLQKTKPRTGLVYVMWLVLQNHIVYLNGFDHENTDLLTHVFQPKKNITKQHDAKAEGIIIKQLISEKLVVMV